MSAPISRTNLADSGDMINFEELLNRLDTEFGETAPGLIERFRFDVDGMTFEARRIQHEKGPRFLVTATMGYLPFSIESSERRDAIKKIVLESRALPNVRFAIDAASKVTVGALFEAPQTKSPDFVFYPLTQFMQEARPFMRLIGKYLEGAA